MDHDRPRSVLTQVAPEPGRIESSAERTASREGRFENAVPGSPELEPDAVSAALGRSNGDSLSPTMTPPLSKRPC